MELVVRATIIYWFLWLVVRGTGKRSLSELTPLDLLITVVLGDFVQQGVTQEDMSMTGAIIVVSTFVAWMLLGDALSRRSNNVERVLDGEAVVVMQNGEPDLRRLRIERLTIADLHASAREAGYGDLSEVRLAVLEHDGKFSFIPGSGGQRH
jgi:uncharacterized membrane protein YcaP (DUF421 family)